ncbi:MAG: nickel pincer cofactor biosynthesis protein LarC [Ilumatobacteraceae bacterium]
MTAARVAWFNCSAGVAGDMTMAALVHAGADADRVAEILGGLPVHDYALSFEPALRAGVSCVRALVAVHEHEHHHRPWSTIDAMLAEADLPERVAERARRVFRVLAEVEGDIHGVRPEEVEFHEVGSTDAIVDVVGVCAALEVLDIDRVACGSIGTGHGSVVTAHGSLPNPAPAVVALAARRGLVLRGLDDHRELATPTGVAIMAALADHVGALPDLVVEARGHGAGSIDVDGRANVVQVVVGTETRAEASGESVRLLEANVDDVTGEVLAHTIASLLEAGAHDAWSTAIVMKKGRPAHTLHVLCDPTLTQRMIEVLVAETGTLGVRGTTVDRWPQRREESAVDVSGHLVRVKIARGRVKVEHDDALAAARSLGVPLRDVLRRAEELAQPEPN